MKKMVVGLAFTFGLMAAPNLGEASLSADTILNTGATGDDVRTVQEEMSDATSHSLAIDGIYGPNTREAVLTFQRDNGLQVDGIVGPETISAMSGTSSSSSDSSSSQASSSGSTSGSWDGSVLRSGDRGGAVSDLQSELNDATSHSLTVDGVYGPKTRAAVTAFQQSAGIGVDGIAGPNTYSAITGSSSSASDSSGSSSSNDSATSASGGGFVESLISEAESHMGTPYSWGGAQPGAMDSSGFIVYSFSQVGIDLPRTHADYYPLGTDVSSPQRGDVVFFETYKSGPSHAGIYLGNNQFIHSSSSQGVTVDSMSNSYWEPRYIGAKRFH
ncbi:peptidoglycan-binding protein [Salisediminibacterium halotolerans]|uniref:Peptidoglycan binding domain-containing protein n=1 Tax=Salisediminibacterium halotolerans TaxID=517425 RepID=A0A1H9TUA8_9BACI|nr:peptidoglycan-binding protein [Salisediminibacterium haloalkalitolerans]SES00537.1 Putative peptidoglycan binding domain-containing protein [Salisediminibacterium haloalkalitolerans]